MGPILAARLRSKSKYIIMLRVSSKMLRLIKISAEYLSGLVSFLLARGTKLAADGINKEKNKTQLPSGGLDPELVPKHVAVIMDGNRRWAINRALPSQLGHAAGGRVLKPLALDCMKYGVQILTVFAFSTENWTHPKEEVDFLMTLFEDMIVSDIEELIKDHDVRASVMGNVSQVPQTLQNALYSSQERSEANKGLHLVIALNYSGRYDITEATRKIAAKVKDGVLKIEHIDDKLLEQHLETNKSVGNFVFK